MDAISFQVVLPSYTLSTFTRPAQAAYLSRLQQAVPGERRELVMAGV